MSLVCTSVTLHGLYMYTSTPLIMGAIFCCYNNQTERNN
jgi:hypothetical protein